MEKNKNEMQFESNVDTGADNIETTLASSEAIDDSMLSNFDEIVTEDDLVEKEKINELNKKLPSWSLEPPHTFIK